MRMSCEIIRDLLPLYEDKVCSEKSRKAVEEHLAECEGCRRLSDIKLNISEEYTENNDRDEKAVRKGLKKIRFRWALSIVAAILIVPVLLLGVNQARGRGVCFTNIDDILTAEHFAKAIEKGEYQKASDMIDCEKLYYDVQDVLKWELDEYIGKYRTIEIDGRQWTVSEHLYDEYVINLSEGDIWSFMVTELSTPVIPREQFEKIASQYPEKIVKNGTDEYTLNNTEYNLVKTDHGYYYVSENSHVNERSHAIELFYDLYIAEFELYEEVEPMLIKQAEDHYNYNQKYYENAKNMTLSEFENFISEDYEEGLKNWKENGFAIKNISLNGCGYSEMHKGWITSFDAEITKGEKAYRASVSVSVHNGKIRVEAVDVKTDNTYIDHSLYTAFYLDYPGAI